MYFFLLAVIVESEPLITRQSDGDHSSRDSPYISVYPDIRLQFVQMVQVQKRNIRLYYFVLAYYYLFIIFIAYRMCTNCKYISFVAAQFSNLISTLYTGQRVHYSVYVALILSYFS